MKNNHGFTLVEMLISMSLGLFLLSGLGYVAYSLHKTYTLQNELIHMQENGQFAMQFLSNDIRMAGFNGCFDNTPIVNVLASNVDNRKWMTSVDLGIMGISVNSKQLVDSKALSDIIIIHKVDIKNSNAILKQDKKTQQISLSNNHNYQTGDILALSTIKCQKVSIFKAGKQTAKNIISYEANSSEALHNCTTNLMDGFGCAPIKSTTQVFNPLETEISSLNSMAYYLREGHGQTNLYRKIIGESINGNLKSSEALFIGIEQLVFYFGVDFNGDKIPDQYLMTKDIPEFSKLWKSIVSVRIELVVKSKNQIAEKPQSYWLSGKLIEPSDRYIRRVFNATVKIRNRE